MNNEGERDKIIRFLTDEYRDQKDVTENLSISLDSSRIEPGKDNTVRLIVNDGQNMETIDIPFSKEVIDTYFSEKDSNLTDQEMADKTLAMVKNEMNLIAQTPELNTELKSWFEEKGLAVEYDKLMRENNRNALYGANGFGINPGTRTYDLILQQYRQHLKSNLLAMVSREKQWLEDWNNA